jgi:hypothetical protein
MACHRMSRLLAAAITGALLWLAPMQQPASANPPVSKEPERGPGTVPFISPNGEPYVPHDEARDPFETWFFQADQNHDWAISLPELEFDSDRFFRRLDLDRDGEIEPDEMTAYEQFVGDVTGEGPWGSKTPPIGGGARHAPPLSRQKVTRPFPGASKGRSSPRHTMSGYALGSAMFGLLDLPQPVASADLDLNRGVSAAELRRAAGKRFLLLDADRDGRLTFPELSDLRHSRIADRLRQRK